MTPEHQASRTIVKSPPELWAECSDAGSLARHIGEFGEIRITRLEPETTVAWEGEHASGTVEIEPSGWGTRVTLTAHTKGDEVGHSGNLPVPPPEQDQVESPVPETGQVEPTVTGGGRVPPLITGGDQVPTTVTDNQPFQEAADAKVEETSTRPDPVMAAYPVPARGWRRVITAFFRSRAAPGAVHRAPVEVRPSFKVAEPPAVEVADPPPVEVAEPPPPEAADPSRPEAADPPPPESADPAPPEVENAQVPEEADGNASIDPETVLSAALDSLGRAHHRPFSRA